jgi:hypothetical protein
MRAREEKVPRVQQVMGLEAVPLGAGFSDLCPRRGTRGTHFRPRRRSPEKLCARGEGFPMGGRARVCARGVDDDRRGDTVGGVLDARKGVAKMVVRRGEGRAASPVGAVCV